MATIDIPNNTRKYSNIEHNWYSKNDFTDGQSLVKTMPSVDDSTENAASTEWVNLFYQGRKKTDPTINVPLLTPMWFDHKVSSPAWLSSCNSSSVEELSGSDYIEIYDHLCEDIQGKSAITETVDGIEINYIKADDGHKIITGTDDLKRASELFAECGVAWYYYLDTGNKKFALPRNRYSFQGIKSNGSVGTYDPPGAPAVSSEMVSNGININNGLYVTTQLTKPEYYIEGTTVTASESNVNFTTDSVGHSHTFNIQFAKASSKGGYPYHGDDSPCQHKSNDISINGGDHSHSGTITVPGHSHYVKPTLVTKTEISMSAQLAGNLSATISDKNSKTRENDSVYGKATTVQPPAVEMYLYFSTGYESTKGITDASFPASEKSERKLISTSSKETSSYTATANGWCNLSATSCCTGTGDYSLISIETSNSICQRDFSTIDGLKICASIPIKNGDTATISYSGTFNKEIEMTFVRCEGDKNL